jgi:ribosome maturation protein Sdo1
MGRALEPGEKFPIVLDWDADKPEDQRPTIYTVALSMRRQERLGQVLDEAPNAKNSTEFFNAVEQGLSEVITGWRNFRDPASGAEIPYSRDALKDVFTTSEAYEVFRKVLAGGNVSKADEKNSALQP